MKLRALLAVPMMIAGSLAGGCSNQTTAAPTAAVTTPDDNRPTTAERDPLGLAPGTVWTFRGTRTRWDEATERDVEEPLTWVLRVVDTGHDGDAWWRITGWLADAADWDGPKQGSKDTWLIRRDDDLLIASDADVAAAKQLDGEPWLRLPLTDGDEVCPDGDDVYCWRVMAAGDGFDISFRTNPDVTTFHVVPGRGITRFEYHHNGTTNDVVLERTDGAGAAGTKPRQSSRSR